MTKNAPLISIVTVCYNDRTGLETTVASIDAQSFRNFEHIIIDGASTDGTPDYLHTISQPWRESISEPDTGLYDAMNKGLGKSRGRYVQFLNAGDVFAHDGSLHSAAKHLANSAIIVSLRSINEYGDLSTPLDAERQTYDSYGRFEAMLFDARRLSKTPFDLRYRIKADRDVVLRLIRDGVVMKDINEVFVKIESIGLSSTRIPLKEKENILITWRNVGFSSALLKSIVRAAGRLFAYSLARLFSIDWNSAKRFIFASRG